MIVSEFAPAKINLALHVTGQLEDGYHLLDTLVTFTDIGDRLTFERAASNSLDISGPFASELAAGKDNLVLKAATRWQDMMSDMGRRSELSAITLEKNLPLAAGLGGGSADAAATFRGLSKTTEDPPDKNALSAMAIATGADVLMCLQNEPCRARGIGEQIAPLQLPAFHLVLVNPGKALSTPAVFSELEHRKNEPLAPLPDTNQASIWIDWLSGQRNDLEEPAISLVPEIDTCIRALSAQNCELARMSGSGASCFGIFKNRDEANQAARAISVTHPDWWVAPCSTVC